MKKILFAGETWVNITTHVKGFDSFTTTTYKEGLTFIKAAFEAGGYEVDHIPSHLVPTAFPTTSQDLDRYALVVLSDIGSNTLVLTPNVYSEGLQKTNKLELIRDFVLAGKGLLMVGGYMSFTGYDGKARYGQSPVAGILPVDLLTCDDRVEKPEGCYPVSTSEQANHPILRGLSAPWPVLLGYNRTVPAPDRGVVLATVNGDPLIACGEFGRGRSVAFTSDCAPHWGSQAFIDWHGYPTLWKNVADWLTAGRG